MHGHWRVVDRKDCDIERQIGGSPIRICGDEGYDDVVVPIRVLPANECQIDHSRFVDAHQYDSLIARRYGEGDIVPLPGAILGRGRHCVTLVIVSKCVRCINKDRLAVLVHHNAHRPGVNCRARCRRDLLANILCDVAPAVAVGIVGQRNARIDSEARNLASLEADSPWDEALR